MEVWEVYVYGGEASEVGKTLYSMLVYGKNGKSKRVAKAFMERLVMLFKELGFQERANFQDFINLCKDSTLISVGIRKYNTLSFDDLHKLVDFYNTRHNGAIFVK